MKYDQRALEIDLNRMIQSAITDKGLSQVKVIAALESALRQERELREYAMACQRSY